LWHLTALSAGARLCAALKAPAAGITLGVVAGKMKKDIFKRLIYSLIIGFLLTPFLSVYPGKVRAPFDNVGGRCALFDIIINGWEVTYEQCDAAPIIVNWNPAWLINYIWVVPLVCFLVYLILLAIPKTISYFSNTLRLLRKSRTRQVLLILAAIAALLELSIAFYPVDFANDTTIGFILFGFLIIPLYNGLRLPLFPMFAINTALGFIIATGPIFIGISISSVVVTYIYENPVLSAVFLFGVGPIWVFSIWLLTWLAAIDLSSRTFFLVMRKINKRRATTT